MPIPDRKRVHRAMAESPWETSNRVLYNLCREQPSHRDTGAILAKVLLIGRGYAAAIERRRVKPDDTDGDDFYVDTVEPAIRQSAIDRWLDEARAVQPGTQEGLRTMIRVHAEVTALFNRISGLDKRSLASKYLHFHVPDLFFIYDSRAAEAMRSFSDCLPRASRAQGMGDNDYRKFAEKAFALTRLCQQKHGFYLSPRQLDNLLLNVNR